MKKNVIASILGAAGLVGLAATSYGQGSVLFDTYASTGYFPVTYSPAAQTALSVGLGAGPNVFVELGYALGASQTTGFTLLASTIQAVGTSTAPIDGTGPTVAGYIQGAATSIPTYASGPITFEILAWINSGAGAGGGTFATSGYNGKFIWTEASIAPNPSPAGFFSALTGNAVLVSAAPEPTTLALAGLGGLASLVMLRRKQA